MTGSSYQVSLLGFLLTLRFMPDFDVYIGPGMDVVTGSRHERKLS